MSKIILNNTYFITTDKWNFVLNKICDVQDKKTKEIKSGEKEIAYYSNLYDCIKGFVKYSEKDIVDNSTCTISELLDQLESHIKEIERISVKIEKQIKEKVIEETE